MKAEEARQKIEAVVKAVEGVLFGKPDVVRLVVAALFAGGHVMIEDVPGVGKTVLARALAKAVDAHFRRIQFTPDLLPSDIIGVSVFSQKEDRFVFRRGPIFTNILLADEINRTTPRTQSALLEAMNVGQVSVDGRTYSLECPFMVLATQNPYEFEGTYPLPESQLDRFMLRVEIGYPPKQDEVRVLVSQTHRHPLDNLTPVVRREDVAQIQEAVKDVHIEEALLDYIVALAERTRQSRLLEVGVSPRGCLMLRRIAQAWALLEGRDYVVPDDIKRLAVPTLAHRVILRGAARQDARRASKVIREIVEGTPVPL